MTEGGRERERGAIEFGIDCGCLYVCMSVCMWCVYAYCPCARVCERETGGTDGANCKESLHTPRSSPPPLCAPRSCVGVLGWEADAIDKFVCPRCQQATGKTTVYLNKGNSARH